MNKFVIKILGQRISHLQTIGEIKLNCTIGETMEFAFQKWLSPKELFEKINSIKNDLLWGDIYVKLIN